MIFASVEDVSSFGYQSDRTDKLFLLEEYGYSLGFSQVEVWLGQSDCPAHLACLDDRNNKLFCLLL